MPQPLPTSLIESRASRLELARHQFFEEGVPPTGIVSDAVFESWARCLRLRHSPRERAVFQPVTASRTHSALQKNRQLHAAWLRELPQLEAVLGASTCAAMLTDATGILIGATCAGRAHEELMPVATRIGVDLSEDAVGTTAPGVAARTGRPVRVLGGEHFFEGVSGMYCAAAPIRDISGTIAGVLDISSERMPFGFDAAPIVSLYAGAIENHLLVQQSADHLVIRFQVSPELLDSAMVAMVGIDAKGRVAWQNAAARGLLGSDGPAGALTERMADALLGANVDRLTDLPAQGAGLLTLPNGLMVWARAEMRSPDGRRGLIALALPGSGTESPLPARATQPVPGEVADAVLSTGNPVNEPPAGIPPEPAAQVNLTGTLRDVDLGVITAAVERCGGNVSQAARLLGVSRGLIYRRLRDAGGLPARPAQALRCSQTEQFGTPS